MKLAEWLELKFIFSSNYEEMVQYHRNMPKDENAEVNDETKFDLVSFLTKAKHRLTLIDINRIRAFVQFTKFADNLFHSFSTMVSTNSFAEMSSSILNWIEHSCSANVS